MLHECYAIGVAVDEVDLPHGGASAFSRHDNDTGNVRDFFCIILDFVNGVDTCDFIMEHHNRIFCSFLLWVTQINKKRNNMSKHE